MPFLSTLNSSSSFIQLPDLLHTPWLPVLPKNIRVLHSHLFYPFESLKEGWSDEELITELKNAEQAEGAFANSFVMKYTGHQFGYYNPDLGDGRGVFLKEVTADDGERWDLHLKGAGKTPFSRFGDGRAVLRSTIREYLAGIAMRGLNIPTTSALAILGSDEYTARNGMEPCALLLRTTRCHIRFGHFEFLYYTRRHDELKELADYCIERYAPELKDAAKPYLAFFAWVKQKTAQMIAYWQAYGFVHGVMNTDNMSIIGETFDYGPYTFMDGFQNDFLSNQNDHERRYTFERQPNIAKWNLTALAQALIPLIEQSDLEAELDSFDYSFQQAYYTLVSARMGLELDVENLCDRQFVDLFFELASKNRLDINRLFAALTYQSAAMDLDLISSLSHESCAVPIEQWSNWIEQYQSRVAKSELSSRNESMKRVNPRFILRNYIAEEVIRDVTAGNTELLGQVCEMLAAPFAEHADLQRYEGAPPDWAAGICLTCSS